MPEGDTIYAIATRLRPLLQDRSLERLWLRDCGEVKPLSGCPIGAIHTHGKHLLIDVGGEHTLRVHLGMKGSWHRYRKGEPWKRSRANAVAWITTRQLEVVCFGASAAELLNKKQLRSHQLLSRLGPDLMESAIDLAAIATHAAASQTGDTALGEVLLDQQLAAGIGNVVKSEACFLAALDPRRTVAELEVADILRAYQEAHAVLRQNAHGRRRTTVPSGVFRATGERLFVYGRKGRPCHRCGTPIERFLQGKAARTTFVCPRCQR